jgi:outer membrane protein OmpA-like peptidoglycan-associated protein
MWNGQGFLDLYFIDSSTNLKPRILKKLSPKFHEGPICFSSDKSKVYITKNNISKLRSAKSNSGILNIKLYIADLDSSGNWSNMRECSLNSNDYSIGHPTLSTDGKTMYFVSDMPGGFGGADLYMATVDSSGDLSNPINLGSSINTEGQEMFPWISPDGLFYFSSNGHIGLGGLDVFVTPIAEDKINFSEIRNVGKPLNSQYDDFAITFKNDGKTGYFSSNRPGGKGNDDIYSLDLIKPFVFKMNLKGIVIDSQTKLALAGSNVFLMDENQTLIDSLVADKFGAFSFVVEPEKNYSVTAKYPDYSSNQSNVSTNNTGEKSIDLIIELTKIPKIGLIGTIKDTKTNLLLEDVSIVITDKVSKQEIFNGKTAQNGDFLKELTKSKINDQLNFVITISKTGYLTKEIDFVYRISKPGLINISEMLDVSIGKVDLGVDLAKLIEIKPIYFDKGKYIIRKDAAIELDKIVKIMNEYPTMELELGSHTDCRSSIASNLKLSDNRAKASAEYIKKRISNPQRINGKGYGESKLIIDCPCEGKVKSKCSEEDHQKNRRTEFIVLKM